MEKIEMCSRNWWDYLSTHAVTGFEQRPIKRFAVERDEYRVLRDPLTHSEQERAFLPLLAQEELLDLQPAAFPPPNADEQRVRAASASNAPGPRSQQYAS